MIQTQVSPCSAHWAAKPNYFLIIMNKNLYISQKIKLKKIKIKKNNMWVTFSRICKEVYCSVFLDNQYNDYLKTPIFVLQSNMDVKGSSSWGPLRKEIITPQPTLLLWTKQNILFFSHRGAPSEAVDPGDNEWEETDVLNLSYAFYVPCLCSDWICE